MNALLAANGTKESKSEIMSTVEEMRDTQGTSSFKDNYNKFMSVLSDHMQVYGSVVAPFLPALTLAVP